MDKQPMTRQIDSSGAMTAQVHTSPSFYWKEEGFLLFQWLNLRAAGVQEWISLFSSWRDIEKKVEASSLPLILCHSYAIGVGYFESAHYPEHVIWCLRLCFMTWEAVVGSDDQWQKQERCYTLLHPWIDPKNVNGCTYFIYKINGNEYLMLL